MLTSVALTALMSFSVTVHSWHYDPQQKAIVLQLVNASSKDVTAFSISITLTYADGSTDYRDARPNSPGGFLEDLLGSVLHPRDGNSRPFAAGTMRDVVLPQAKAISNVDAFVDMVVYADGTAESTNDLMLKEIFAGRTGALLAMEHTNEIIKRVLADQSKTPMEDVAKGLSEELARFKEAHKKWQPDQLDETPGLTSAIQMFESMQRQQMALEKQTERLTNCIAQNEKEIEALRPHTKLVTK